MSDNFRARPNLRHLALGALLIFLVSCAASAQSSSAKSASARAAGADAASWHFAVSGDSRNCGDVIMPEIAAGAKSDHAIFYWHLGDLRWISQVDQDFQQLAQNRWGALGIRYYESHAWDDFIENQIKPFEPLPFYLGIGNHETAFPKSRAEFLQQFSPWLDTSALRGQRLADDPKATQARTYYHWIRGGVDFINLDNATHDQFDSAQLAWFEARAAHDAGDPKIAAVVVGMHAALPESISIGHSMNEWPQGISSGRQVYDDLLKLQNVDHKNVYVLASHSHYFMAGIFNTLYWRAHGGVLPGWIVGTAGATRYPLPPEAKDAATSAADVYGYLLATVNPPDQRRGTISFQFREIDRNIVPTAIAKRFTPALVDQCFNDNRR